MTAKVGYVRGVCSVCGRKIRRLRPADYAVCDCWEICPLCGRKMEPYTPDMTPPTYESEKGLNVFYVCSNHSPPYYSKQKPVEVRLT